MTKLATKLSLSFTTLLLTVSFQAIGATPMESKLNQILQQNNAKVDDSQKVQLLSQFDLLSRMNNKQQNREFVITQLQKWGACGAADLYIIVNGVGEGLPILGMGVREHSLRTAGLEIDPELSEILMDGRWSLKALFGSAVDSVFGVSLEALSTFDKEKIEAEIQKSFPGTSMVAAKLKGEKSFCGMATLKLDMLRALLNYK